MTNKVMITYLTDTNSQTECRISCNQISKAIVTQETLYTQDLLRFEIDQDFQEIVVIYTDSK